jgi:predicted  nucleic acid-binding Zn-ribbon protein
VGVSGGQPKGGGVRTADVARRVEVAEQRMDTMEERLDASYSALNTQILQSRRESKEALLATRDELRGEIAATRGDLHGEIEALRTDTQAGFARLERMLADGLDEIRRFMKVLYEDTLSRIALLAEHRPTS